MAFQNISYSYPGTTRKTIGQFSAYISIIDLLLVCGLRRKSVFSCGGLHIVSTLTQCATPRKNSGPLGDPTWQNCRPLTTQNMYGADYNLFFQRFFLDYVATPTNKRGAYTNPPTAALYTLRDLS